MWNIKPSINKCFDCFTGLVVSFCEYHNISYEKCFLQPWGFFISDVINGNVVDNIKLCNSNSFFSNLEDFYGLKIEQRNISTMTELKGYISNNIAMMPIIINIDAYDCIWCEIYQKYHFSHYVMIVDSSNNSVLASDSYFPIDAYRKIQYSDIRLLTDSVYSLHFDKTELGEVSVNKKIKEIICFMEEHNILCNIKKLMEIFIAPNALRRETDNYGDNFQYSPIFLLLKRFADDRQCYAMALETINNNVFKDSIISFNKTNKLYLNLVNVIFKGIIIGDINLEKIENLFHKIFAQENESLQLLKNTIQKDEIPI